MNEKKVYKQCHFEGECSLFQECGATIVDTVFDEGESPLKESSNIELSGCIFKGKYPIWYSNNVSSKNCLWLPVSRAGMWYTNHLKIEDATIGAPKCVRRCKDIVLCNVSFSDAQETLWSCEDVVMDHVTVKGDYFAMNSNNMKINDLDLSGQYPFDEAKNILIDHSRLITKDAFWNSENVTVKNSYIFGEYLGWNAKNLTLINCTIESLQGLCYVDHLILENCKLLNTTLAFEYSTVNAQVNGRIDSIMNPSGGIIRADEIGEIIMQKDKVDISKTEIVIKKYEK